MYAHKCTFACVCVCMCDVFICALITLFFIFPVFKDLELLTILKKSFMGNVARGHNLIITL